MTRSFAPRKLALAGAGTMLLLAGLLSAAGPGFAAGSATVTIKDYAFSPATLTVARGTTVTWSNRDGTSHLVVSDSPAMPYKSPSLSTNNTFSVQFNQPGNFPYHCDYHSNMNGTIVVR